MLTVGDSEFDSLVYERNVRVTHTSHTGTSFGNQYLLRLKMMAAQQAIHTKALTAEAGRDSSKVST